METVKKYTPLRRGNQIADDGNGEIDRREGQGFEDRSGRQRGPE